MISGSRRRSTSLPRFKICWQGPVLTFRGFAVAGGATSGDVVIVPNHPSGCVGAAIRPATSSSVSAFNARHIRRRLPSRLVSRGRSLWAMEPKSNAVSPPAWRVTSAASSIGSTRVSMRANSPSCPKSSRKSARQRCDISAVAIVWLEEPARHRPGAGQCRGKNGIFMLDMLRQRAPAGNRPVAGGQRWGNIATPPLQTGGDLSQSGACLFRSFHFAGCSV